MRVLFVGDAAVSTGFARCTHAACDALHAAGHEVHVLGINYFGDPHEYPYPIYPCISPHNGGNDVFGVGRLPRLAATVKPDVIVLLNDPWNVPPYLGYLKQAKLDDIPVIGWLAVDAANQKGAPLNELEHVMVWTDWAGRELQRGGYEGEYSVVPLGVDHSVFYPRDRDESRKACLPESVPSDAFIVGVVGRNQPRKRLDLTLEYFAEWVKSEGVSDAYLYLHVAPTGERGADLQSLTRYHGLRDRVIMATPNIGHGVSSDHLAQAYSAFDVYLTTTQGEGWGLPALEAMACGVPCIVPDCAGLGDWVGGAALKVPCAATALSAPLNAAPYTVGGIPDKAATVAAMRGLYITSSQRRGGLSVSGRQPDADLYRNRGLELAAILTWQATGEAFVREIESSIRTTGPVAVTA